MSLLCLENESKVVLNSPGCYANTCTMLKNGKCYTQPVRLVRARSGWQLITNKPYSLPGCYANTLFHLKNGKCYTQPVRLLSRSAVARPDDGKFPRAEYVASSRRDPCASHLHPDPIKLIFYEGHKVLLFEDGFRLRCFQPLSATAWLPSSALPVKPLLAGSLLVVKSVN